MSARRRTAFAVVLLALAAAGCGAGESGGHFQLRGGPSDGQWGIGRQATAQQIAAWDIDVDTLGHGLPAGSGTPAAGAALFAQKCAVCHGPNGEGAGSLFPRLIGRDPRAGFPFGRDLRYVATIGNYWPYATTLYDYIHRAMPFVAPGSLTPEETYSLVAYLLWRNDIIPQTAVVDARTLPAVRMPAHDRFVPDDRRGGAEFR